jgi:dienelactone hydrolase
MSLVTRLVKCLGAATLALAVPWATAGYFQWETVELPASSGASCGNGTPYRFFVNRTPLSRDLAVTYEGGGACWDQKACLGEGKLGATNPNGVPPDYMRSINVAFGLVTPFSARNDPAQAVQTQSWNLVFLPYCTGDVHGGSKVTVYDDAYPDTPRLQYHRGQANVSAAAAWLRANLGQPAKMMLTGYSAGGVGSTVTYALMRNTLQPTGAATLLADSGPLMNAPRSGTPEMYPSLPLHNRIREAWGLDEPEGLVTRFSSLLTNFDPDNLGSVSGALATTYPEDRFGYMAFTRDTNFSAFSYEDFYDDIANAPNPRAYRKALFSRWWPDLDQWSNGLEAHANVSYHRPYFRNFNQSHCLTIVDFSGTGIEVAGVDSLASFVDNALDRGVPMRHVEPANKADFTQPLSPFIRFFKLLERLLA